MGSFGLAAWSCPINAIVGYLQEAKAEKAIEALAKMVITEATVRRDGVKRRISSEGLVPGDVVLLQSGDKVPADLRLFRVRNLHVDESALTGESVPVEKHADALVVDTILAERRNQTFAGTLVTYGQAEGAVWAIGDQTETGRIATLMADVNDLATPLTRKIARFSKGLLVAILALAAVTFGMGVARGESLVQMFMAAVAPAVGGDSRGSARCGYHRAGHRRRLHGMRRPSATPPKPWRGRACACSPSPCAACRPRSASRIIPMWPASSRSPVCKA